MVNNENKKETQRNFETSRRTNHVPIPLSTLVPRCDHQIQDILLGEPLFSPKFDEKIQMGARVAGFFIVF